MDKSAIGVEEASSICEGQGKEFILKAERKGNMWGGRGGGGLIEIYRLAERHLFP